MTETAQTEQPFSWRCSRTARITGHVLALVSLLPFVIYCMDIFYVNASEEPGLVLSAFQWFTIFGIAVALAATATFLRSKLWRLALPISLLMFFFMMYVMRSSP